MERKSFVCKVCEKHVDVTRAAFERSLSMTNGCCQLRCFKRTDEYKERRREADSKRVTTIRERKGFREPALRSKVTRARNFLDSIGIAHVHLTDSEALSAWKSNFDSSAHGEKITRGLKQKYGDDLSQLYRERVLKAACSILGEEYRTDFSELEKRKIYDSTYGAFFRVSDSTNWKRTHLIRQLKMQETMVSALSDDEVDRKYSEYISNRFRRSSLECCTNGYTRTSKGWYEFGDGSLLFYRSSWENEVFIVLDDLLVNRKIKSVKDAPKVKYFFEDRYRHYFPDVAYETTDGKFLF